MNNVRREISKLSGTKKGNIWKKLMILKRTVRTKMSETHIAS